MMKVKIVYAITILVALPAAAETKSRPIRQELVHVYARKQIPLAKAAHAATYACHEVTSNRVFSILHCHTPQLLRRPSCVITRRPWIYVSFRTTFDIGCLPAPAMSVATDPFQKFAVASTSQKPDIRSRYGANEWSVGGAIQVRFCRKLL
jgi:hypothetical protein